MQLFDSKNDVLYFVNRYFLLCIYYEIIKNNTLWVVETGYKSQAGVVRMFLPLNIRLLLYLKLTLSADVDIPVVRDNLTHYADGFHCNARTPLQGYAMPLLHSVSA